MAELPRNVCGTPVKGENFFGRTKEIDDIWDRLATDHVLLTAPRRVGKTSIMFRLQNTAASREEWFGAVYYSAEAALDETAFVAGLFAEIAKSPRCGHVADALSRNRRGELAARVAKLSVAALSMELRNTTTTWSTLAAELQDAVYGLPPQGRLLVMVDELPVFLQRLLALDRSRAEAFLSWFRSFRQGRPERSNDVRWLLAGSIGLAPLASRQRWTKLINDLHESTIGPLDRANAQGLLDGLATRYRLQLSPAERDALLERLGWPIPYFLQLAVDALRKLPPGTERTDRVLATLCGPESQIYFAPWWQRLDEELGAVNASAAAAILTACAIDPDGAAKASMEGIFVRFWTDRDRDAQRRALFERLEHDGYLVFERGRWRFRSPLLREVWLERTSR